MGDCQEKGKILKSQKKSVNFDVGHEMLKFMKMPGKSQEKWSIYQYEALIPNYDCQCHDVVAQSFSRWQEILMQDI